MSTEGLLDVIRIGTWVRLKTDSTVPEWARGQNAVVVRAPVEHVQTDPEDSESPVNFSRQHKNVKFLVRVRESSQELEVKRAAFSAVASNVGDLATATVGGRWPAPEDMGPNVPEGELVFMGEKEGFVDPHEEVDSTDIAEERAKELNVDISMVRGTGKDGRVTKHDVESYASGRS